MFKYKEKGVDQRLYGFLYHPKPKTHPRFQICVLAFHDSKTQWITEASHKSYLNQLRKDPKVQAAIKRVYPELEKKG